MHVKNAREVPEYEIDPKELDFTNSVELTKVIRYSFCGQFTLQLVQLNINFNLFIVLFCSTDVLTFLIGVDPQC